VRESWVTLARVPGARAKRLLLTALGRVQARRLDRAGYPGNDWLAGAADARRAGRADFFTRWLTRARGRVVELMCHPGHYDPSLLGRDAFSEADLRWRVDEARQLAAPEFRTACERAGFRLAAPAETGAGRGFGLTA
jgi:hypothetical protein